MKELINKISKGFQWLYNNHIEILVIVALAIVLFLILFIIGCVIAHRTRKTRKELKTLKLEIADSFISHIKALEDLKTELTHTNNIANRELENIRLDLLKKTSTQTVVYTEKTKNSEPTNGVDWSAFERDEKINAAKEAKKRKEILNKYKTK